MKIILTLILTIFLIGIISSTEINLRSGESYSFDLGQTYSYYSIVENSSFVGLNVSQEGTIVNISLGKYSPSDSFEILFFNIKNEVIQGYSGGGYYEKPKTAEKNNTIDLPQNFTETLPPIVPEIPAQKGIWLYWVSLGISIFGIICLIISSIKKRKYRVERRFKENE
jgi:hypothetical protein